MAGMYGLYKAQIESVAVISSILERSAKQITEGREVVAKQDFAAPRVRTTRVDANFRTAHGKFSLYNFKSNSITVNF